jgi:putative N6-adenine-specific DNA methylase/tRNA (guanine6-N2)-methyltransferase
MRYLLTTDPGLEDIVVDELRQRSPEIEAAVSTGAVGGQVRVVTDDSRILFRLGTVHHVLELRCEDRATSLDDVRRLIREADFDELAGASSFRVTSARQGDHDFDRVDLQRAAGAVLVERFGTQVDLQGFEVEVRVDLYGDRLVAGIQRTRESLGKRVRRGRVLRSSLKPTIAAAMLRLAGAHRGDGLLIDPMCGSGVIPVEALRLNPGLVVSASDWDGPTVEAARGTFANHEIEIAPQLADARSLGQEFEGVFDYIVTDPPYGVRQAKRSRMTSLYAQLLSSFERALKPTGKLCIIVVKHRVFVAALERTGLQVVHQRTIQAGALSRRIYVLGRTVPAAVSVR